jgi:gamma-glutamyltranspeptidase / glutathione hydrolase
MQYPAYNIDRFNSRRSPVFARNGMVAAAHPLATLAGIEILKEGGSAVDAAIAAAAVLGVVEPYQTGLGGDAFALIYHAPDGHVTALNASGPAPRAATIEAILGRGLDRIPARSPLAWTVPGCVDGWWQMSARDGCLPWARLLEPAIHYASEGFALSPCDAASWQLNEAVLRADPAAARSLLIDGKVPRAGDTLVQADLAATLTRVAAGGREEFYEGETAQYIVAAARALGGLLEASDLRDYRAQWQEPIEIPFHGCRILQCPPNGQGLAALIALQALADVQLPKDRDSKECWHLLIEAMKLGMSLAATYVGDPNFVQVPVEQLLTREYAQSYLTAQYATDAPGNAPSPSDTVYVAVVDAGGNAVSFINSVFDDFGTGHVVSGGGFSMQSRGQAFSLDPAHPNSLQPGKRPYHTIIPAMALLGDQLLASFGVTGGYMQPQGHLQLLVNLLGYGMDVQSAIDHPRFWWEAGRRVVIEEGLPETLLAELSAMGHAVTRRVHRGFGGAQIILRCPERGVLIGGSEPRQDGCALGY